MLSDLTLSEIKGFTNRAHDRAETFLIQRGLKGEETKVTNDITPRHLSAGNKSIHDRLYEDAIYRFSKLSEMHDDTNNNTPMKTIHLSKANELYERLVNQKMKTTKRIMDMAKDENSIRYSTPTRRRDVSPVQSSLVHERLYEDAISRHQSKLWESTTDKRNVDLSTKSISFTQAKEIYDRQVDRKKKISSSNGRDVTQDRHMTPNRRSTSDPSSPRHGTSSIYEKLFEDAIARQTKLSETTDKKSDTETTKRISPARAKEFYNRLVNQKMATIKNRTTVAEKKSKGQDSQRKVIPLSEAIGIYERALQSKFVFMYKMEQERKIRRWR